MANLVRGCTKGVDLINFDINYYDFSSVDTIIPIRNHTLEQCMYYYMEGAGVDRGTERCRLMSTELKSSVLATLNL